LFIALGGTAWAIENNSVKSKHIVNGQVKQADLSSPEAFHDAGLPTIGPFNDCNSEDNAWAMVQQGGGSSTVGYYRDRDGFVHLTGQAVACGTVPDLIFTLPPGYRPAAQEYFPVLVYPTGVETVEARVDGALRTLTGIENHEQLSLGTITFRCAPSGPDGCP
jgi:hypothetical protein